jgi:hypothetical protein
MWRAEALSASSSARARDSGSVLGVLQAGPAWVPLDPLAGGGWMPSFAMPACASSSANAQPSTVRPARG